MFILLCVCHIVLVDVGSGGVAVACFTAIFGIFLLFFVPVSLVFSLLVLIMTILLYIETNFKFWQKGFPDETFVFFVFSQNSDS